MKLPLKCDVEYLADFLSLEESQALYDHLIHEYSIDNSNPNISFEGTNVLPALGKIMFMPPKLIEQNVFPESIWGRTASWSPQILALRNRINSLLGLVFDICVCLHYPDGKTGVAYHSDYPAFGDTTIIPSLSLGEKRIFKLREIASQEVFEVDLSNGSLIVMGERCQELYEHSLPEDPKYKNGRINLTFRQYGYAG